MSKQYIVPTLGSGTDIDPYRPDIPAGASFVGQHDPKTNTYLVVVPDTVTVSAKTGRKQLSTAREKSDELEARSLKSEDVNSWKIG